MVIEIRKSMPRMGTKKLYYLLMRQTPIDENWRDKFF
jgi:hypothetical protein